VVQCKRWSDNVGEAVVRDLLGAMKGIGATMGYVATTSSFSEQAREFAHRHSIRLLDLEAILEMASAADQIRPQ
jgi:restriction system protein